MEEFKNSINKSIKDLEKILLIEENQYNILVANLENIKKEISKQQGIHDELLNKNNDILNNNQLKLTNIEKKENEINDREKKIIQREIEIEESRKVSILKNIQDQLHKKIDDLEVCQKQRDFYKKNDNLLVSLCSKYQINYESITLEKIEMCFRESNNIKPSDVKEAIIEIKPSDVKEDVIEIKPCDVEEDVIEEEECIEVQDIEYNGKLYYVDNNKNIYNRLENDDIGEIIGILDNKGKVKLNKKR